MDDCTDLVSMSNIRYTGSRLQGLCDSRWIGRIEVLGFFPFPGYPRKSIEIIQAALEQVQGDSVDYDPLLACELARCAEPSRNKRSRPEKRPDRNGLKDHSPKR